MLGQTHILFGILLSLPIYLYAKQDDLLLFGFAVFGSLIPDINHPNSMISNFSEFTKMFSSQVSKVFHHRRETHNLLMALGAFVVSFLILEWYTSLTYWYSIFLFLGYISHLIGDQLTPFGIPWFYPFSERKKKGFIRTGSKLEAFLFSIMTITLFLLALYLQGILEEIIRF